MVTIVKTDQPSWHVLSLLAGTRMPERPTGRGRHRKDPLWRDRVEALLSAVNEWLREAFVLPVGGRHRVPA